jgi:hypothetical protein
MNKQVLIGAVVFAGTLGLAATPAWPGGGYHSNSASEDSAVSPRVESGVPADFSSENSGAGMTQGMDGYDEEALAEFPTQDNLHASGGWDEPIAEDLSIARRSQSGDESWNGIESKNDRDFHS